MYDFSLTKKQNEESYQIISIYIVINRPCTNLFAHIPKLLVTSMETSLCPFLIYLQNL